MDKKKFNYKLREGEMKHLYSEGYCCLIAMYLSPVNKVYLEVLIETKN